MDNITTPLVFVLIGAAFVVILYGVVRWAIADDREAQAKKQGARK